jgi:hypothetical protein
MRIHFYDTSDLSMGRGLFVEFSDPFTHLHYDGSTDSFMHPLLVFPRIVDSLQVETCKFSTIEGTILGLELLQ